MRVPVLATTIVMFYIMMIYNALKPKLSHVNLRISMPIDEGVLRELDEFDSLMRKKFEKYRKMIFLLRDVIEGFDVMTPAALKE